MAASQRNLVNGRGREAPAATLHHRDLGEAHPGRLAASNISTYSYVNVRKLLFLMSFKWIFFWPICQCVSNLKITKNLYTRGVNSSMSHVMSELMPCSFTTLKSYLLISKDLSFLFDCHLLLLFIIPQTHFNNFEFSFVDILSYDFWHNTYLLKKSFCCEI